MKRKNIFRISIAFLAAMSFISCSDQFMQDKQNYDSTTTDAYNYWVGRWHVWQMFIKYVYPILRVFLVLCLTVPVWRMINQSRLKNIVDLVLLLTLSSH